MTQHFFSLLFVLLCFKNTLVHAQKVEDTIQKTEENIDFGTDLTVEELGKEQEQPNIYSVFNDFRIPAKDNINTSDLRYDGWRTAPGMYTFRCRNKKRVRLTLWYLDKGPKEVLDSEFINITPAMGKCHKNDIVYQERSPATLKNSPKTPLETSDYTHDDKQKTSKTQDTKQTQQF